MKFHKLLLIVLFLQISLLGQTRVAITIDDVPNTSKYKADKFNSELLNKLDSFDIPVTIFINEGHIYRTDYVTENFNLLNTWIKKDFVTPGNHTFSHPKYSAVGFENFTNDLIKGECITRELARKYNKPLKYFRFPFNDLGADSLQHDSIRTFLDNYNYVTAPFTVESSDWMFNYIYEYHLRNGNNIEAEEIADVYIETTMEYFKYFDSLSLEMFGRHPNQIYLCHDNSINADYLDVIIAKLKELDVSFVSLDEAMEDEMYSQPDTYYKKWGVSWFYRWMSDKSKMGQLMRNEPDIQEYYNEYERLIKLEE